MSEGEVPRWTAGFDLETAASLTTVAERVVVPGGELVFAEGDASDALYIIERGRLAVERGVAEGACRRRSERGRGEVLGAIGVLTGRPRSATVVALRDSVLWRLGRGAVQGLSQREPGFGLAIARQLAESLTEGERARRAPTPPRTVALLNLSRGQVQLGVFARALAAAFGARSPLIVDREWARGRHGEDDQGAGEGLAARLGALEESGERVLYVTDVDDSAWTRRCLRQADTILLICADDDPSLRPVERLCGVHRRRQGAPRIELVRLLGAEAEAPRGTAAWLRERRVARHHHLRRGRRADLERLARFLVGEPIAVVLGGGGARGLAHLGVLQAFAAMGVPVDVIAGTSSGALVAALFAGGMGPSAIAEQAPELGRALTRDLRLPLVSLLSGRRLSAKLREVFAGRRIEDSWLPCLMVSADLFGAELVVHEEGLAWEAARAGVSVPGLLPPVRSGPRLLVDGAVVNNLPSDELRERYPSAVITAWDSSVPRRPLPTPPRGGASGWRGLVRRLRGRGAGMWITETVARGFTLGATRQIAEIRRRPDMLYAQLPVGHIGLFDVSAAEELIAIGYEEGCARIGEWRAAGRLPGAASHRPSTGPSAPREVRL